MFVLDTAPLAEALRLKLTVTTRSLPEVLNHAGKNLALRAVQYTRAVAPATITAELAAVTFQRLVGKTGRVLKRTKTVTKPNSLARGIVAARLWKKGVNPATLSGADFDAAMDKLISARRASGSYLKAGWLPAAQVFGASVSGVNQFGEAHGSGKLATVDDLLATLENTVPALWKPGVVGFEEAQQSLQYAFDFVAEDVLIYVDQKLALAGFTH